MSTEKDYERYEQALSKLAPSERQAVENFNGRSPAPRLTAQERDGKISISNDHPDTAIGMLMLAQALGTADVDFARGVIGEIADLSWSGRQMSESELNYLRSIVVGMRPQNPVQTMLAVELAANHKLLLENARRAANANILEEHDSAIQAHHKLSRNFAALAEAIQRLHGA